MRRFQIIDGSKAEGRTSYYYFDAEDHETDEQIRLLAAARANVAKNEQRERYLPSIFYPAPKYRRTLKVVEYELIVRDENKKIVRGGCARRGGLKFTLRNSWVDFKFADGSTRRINGYV